MVKCMVRAHTTFINKISNIQASFMTICSMVGVLLEKIMVHSRQFMKETFSTEKNMEKESTNMVQIITITVTGPLTKSKARAFITTHKACIMVNGTKIRSMVKARLNLMTVLSLKALLRKTILSKDLFDIQMEMSTQVIS